MDTPDEKYQQLQAEMRPYDMLMAKATEAILDQEISSYPIFVVHRKPIELGIALLEQPMGKLDWSIRVSTLEELAAKNVVGMDKIDAFREVYKDPSAFYCLFVVEESDAAFIFLPRHSEA